MNTIAFAVLLLTCVALSQQEDAAQEAHKKEMQENMKACVQESGVNPDLPRKAFKDGDFPDDKNFKCFVKCLFQKWGRMDSNGNLNMNSALTYIPPTLDKAKVTAAVDKCKNTKGADPCETAFLAAKCFREAMGPLPSHGH